MAGDYISPPFEPGSLQTQHTYGDQSLAPPRPDNGKKNPSTHPGEPPRPNIHKLLANKDHTWSGIVRDYDDCQELTRQYMSLNDKTGDTDVAGSNDFPEDKKAQKELARQLFEAILEVDPAASEHIHYKPIRELSNLEVELLSWELLFATRRAQDGIVGWAKWSLKPGQRYQKCKNFQERFAFVKEGCRKFKSVVHSMLLAPFITRITAAPTYECRLKTANKKINERKGAQLKGYRDIMAEKKPKSEDNPPASSKRKRKPSDKGEKPQIISRATNYKRQKIEIPGKLAAVAVVSPSVPRGPLSNIPSGPGALSKAEARKGPSVSRDSPNAPNLTEESLANLGRPLTPSAHQMPTTGAADVGCPVAQPNPAALVYPPTAFSRPPLACGPPGPSMSQVFEEVLSDSEGVESWDQWVNFEVDA